MTKAICAAELTNCLPALQRFATSLTKNADRGADLTQDTVARALLKQHLFDGRNLRSWLFTICRRVFLNQIRSQKTRAASIPVEDAPQAAVSVDQDQEISMHFHDVAAAFERLPLNDKVVISLVVIEGLKYEEVAAALDVPIGTVRSRLSRARARLQEMAGGDDAEEKISAAIV
ncbi:MAG: RNA polymerase sigma factor [Parvularculaceae bacterium]